MQIENVVEFQFSDKTWKSPGKGGWTFVSLPKKLSRKIQAELKDLDSGWGRIACEAIVGDSRWHTSVWFDTKRDCYLLPLKKDIREKEKIKLEKSYDFIVIFAEEIYSA